MTRERKFPTMTVAAFVFALCGSPAAVAGESGLNVTMNHAKVLRLDRPVSKVIIGNAEVADVTVADSMTVVLTGKNFGSTNLVLLDADGNAIADERISVSVDEADTVRLYRQADRVVLSCTPTCEQNTAKTASQ